MSEKFNRLEWLNKDNMLSWFILIGTSAKTSEVNSKANINPLNSHENEVIDTIVFSINGVDIEVRSSFELLEAYMNKRIEEEATRLFLERIHGNEFLKRISSLLERFSNEMKNSMEELGFKTKD